MAEDREWVLESGASNANPAGIATLKATACYKRNNARSTGRALYTNKHKNHAYRAASVPQVTLGFELAMTELAAELGMDPLAFRLKNAVEEGDVNMMGAPYKRIGLRECLEVASTHADYKAPVAEGEGRGVAAG